MSNRLDAVTDDVALNEREEKVKRDDDDDADDSSKDELRLAMCVFDVVSDTRHSLVKRVKKGKRDEGEAFDIC